MTIKIGDRLPDVTFYTVQPLSGDIKRVTTKEVFSNKRVILFGIPGNIINVLYVILDLIPSLRHIKLFRFL